MKPGGVARQSVEWETGTFFTFSTPHTQNLPVGLTGYTVVGLGRYSMSSEKSKGCHHGF